MTLATFRLPLVLPVVLELQPRVQKELQHQAGSFKSGVLARGLVAVQAQPIGDHAVRKSP